MTNPLPEPAYHFPRPAGKDPLPVYTVNQMREYAAAECVPLIEEIEALRQDGSRLTAEVAAARDCRTCKHMVWDGEALCAQDVCTNADRYEALPPVRLWRTT